MTDYSLHFTHAVDELAIIMGALISYIGICVIGFAGRYMKGDKKYHSFFIYVSILIFSVFMMVVSDNIFFLLISSCFSNFILVRLMIHKSKWKAAHASGMIAAKNCLMSAICMASAFGIFYFSSGEVSLRAIIDLSNHSFITQIALVLLLLAAMAQSALWPFHKWLISSLNSPTPVSAIMHAGLINGGSLILVRFSPLYIDYDGIMTAIFVIGMISALLGTLWKLMQSDVKRMLACSTLSQMGFTFVQCGLGLFPFAVAHLFWHGMFKAYLFLASGSAAQEKRLPLSYPPKPLTLLSALFCGWLGSLVFAYAGDKSWLTGDSTLVLMVMVFIALSQSAVSLLSIGNLRNFFLACVIAIGAGFLYSVSTQLITSILAPMELMQPKALNIFHLIGIALLTLSWFFMLFIPSLLADSKNYPNWMLKAYVKALNSSQPHPDTITSHRNYYQYS